MDLPNLASTRISIGSNALDSASLPAAWASASLQLLNISGNELAGLLPSVWASKLPQLASLDARGNRMRGTRFVSVWWCCDGCCLWCGACPCLLHAMPVCAARPLPPQPSALASQVPVPVHCPPAGPIPKLWVQGGFAGEMVLALRPGNSEVCGERWCSRHVACCRLRHVANAGSPVPSLPALFRTCVCKRKAVV